MLSSVAALLTIFLVAIVDWLITGQRPSAAALAGGLLIVGAFAGLSWATWKEMKEEATRSSKEDLEADDDEEEEAEGMLDV